MSEEKNEPITYKDAYAVMANQIEHVRAVLLGFAIGRPECDFYPLIDRLGNLFDETEARLKG